MTWADVNLAIGPLALSKQRLRFALFQRLHVLHLDSLLPNDNHIIFINGSATVSVLVRFLDLGHAAQFVAAALRCDVHATHGQFSLHFSAVATRPGECDPTTTVTTATPPASSTATHTSTVTTVTTSSTITLTATTLTATTGTHTGTTTTRTRWIQPTTAPSRRPTMAPSRTPTRWPTPLPTTVQSVDPCRLITCALFCTGACGWRLPTTGTFLISTEARIGVCATGEVTDEFERILGCDESEVDGVQVSEQVDPSNESTSSVPVWSVLVIICAVLVVSGFIVVRYRNNRTKRASHAKSVLISAAATSPLPNSPRAPTPPHELVYAAIALEMVEERLKREPERAPHASACEPPIVLAGMPLRPTKELAWDSGHGGESTVDANDSLPPPPVEARPQPGPKQVFSIAHVTVDETDDHQDRSQPLVPVWHHGVTRGKEMDSGLLQEPRSGEFPDGWFFIAELDKESANHPGW
jgi:hypothetical protein